MTLSEGRCHYLGKEFAVIETHKDKPVMILRKGMQPKKEVNRVAKMCGMKVVGRVQKAKNKLYYAMEKTNG